MRASSQGLANLDWAYVALDTLAAAGVQHVVLSPGSRSTPLALAVNRHTALTVTVLIDERAAAFHALGIAKGSGRPVALVCTSGTAAVNYHPALAEAAASGVPLIALTADRPPRLRGLGAAQTLDQVRLYGPTTAYLELPVATADLTARRAMATRLALAVAATPAGPTHVNVPFDEPLAPSRDELLAWTPPAFASPRLVRGRITADAQTLGLLAERVAAARRPVLLAGPGAGEAEAGEALLAWAAACRMPVIADVGSGLRGLAGTQASLAEVALVTHADLFLRPTTGGAGFAPAAAGGAYGPPELVPDLLMLTGGAVVSKAIATWAAASGADVIALWPDARGRDPDALATLAALGDVADAFSRLDVCAGDAAWSQRWRAAEAHAAAAVSTGPIPAEAAAVRAAAASLPAHGHLALSNSLPIRHADSYGGPAHRTVVYRGANGIDGVTAASLGFAVGAAAPVLLVTGDLAFLHDLGGLATARALEAAGGRAVILVLDNDGGAIFHHLPIADIAPDFEVLFGTPQTRDLPRAAALFDLPCTVAPTPAAVGEAVAAGFQRGGVTVVVFPCNRVETVAHHRAFIATIARQAVGRG